MPPSEASARQRRLDLALSYRARQLAQLAVGLRGDRRCRALAAGYRIAGEHRRIYFHHIRKTAGTSLCWAFLASSGQDGAQLYDRLTRRFVPRLILEDKVFVGWSHRLIEQGHYYYAFSHSPSHAITLPAETFTITCLRDPVKRVISHYRMLREFEAVEPTRPVYRSEGHMLGNCFGDFLDRLPREHLLRQVYMFSRRYDPAEAADAIANCSCVLTTEDFARGLAELSQRIDLPLVAHRAKSSGFTVEVKDQEVERLRTMLEPEYRMYEQLGSLVG